MTNEYTVWQNDFNINIVPDGEETLHYFDAICGCKPKYHMHGDEIVEIFHNSFIGEDLQKGLFSFVNQKLDC
jgi:hypothetical protein